MGEIINLFAKNSKALQTVNNEKFAAVSNGTSIYQNSEAINIFDDIAKKNADAIEKLRKERLQANKNVLKSYRIK